MRLILSIFLSVLSLMAFSQKGKVNNNINVNKSRDININDAQQNIITIHNKNYIDTQIIYNPKKEGTNLLYIIGVKDLTAYKNGIKKDSTFYVTEVHLLNPDSTETRNVNITVKFSKPFKTANFKTNINSIMNPRVIRDSYTTISDDNMTINFKASYIGIGVTLLFTYISEHFGQRIRVEGIGKSF